MKKRWEVGDGDYAMVLQAYFKVGIMSGFRQAVLDSYQIRFGIAPPPEVVEVVEGACCTEDLHRRLEIIFMGSVEKVDAVLRTFLKEEPIRTRIARPRASRRRAATSR